MMDVMIVFSMVKCMRFVMYGLYYDWFGLRMLEMYLLLLSLRNIEIIGLFFGEIISIMILLC